jgi:hypothetical protein
VHGQASSMASTRCHNLTVLSPLQLAKVLPALQEPFSTQNPHDKDAWGMEEHGFWLSRAYIRSLHQTFSSCVANIDAAGL